MTSADRRVPRALRRGGERLPRSGRRRHVGELALEVSGEVQALRLCLLEIALELGAVDARIEVVKVPLRQRAELGRTLLTLSIGAGNHREKPAEGGEYRAI